MKKAKLKINITQKVKSELKSILDSHGYWSDEIKNFIAQFDYISSKKLHSMAHVYVNHREMSTL